MEKDTGLRPLDRDDPGIPMEWFHELNLKCTKWLRARGLYYDTGEWREQMLKRMNAERIVRQATKLDDYVDGLGRD